MIKIILADDHGLVRAGMRLTLKNATDMEVIAEAKTGDEAVLLAQQLKPDLVLMDINMPGTDGFSASLQLLQGICPTKILVISTQQDSVIPARLKQLGVAGYLSKNIDPDTLKAAIRAVHAGETYFDHAMISCATHSPFAALSDRELQIALMLARGIKSSEIAERLFLNKKTVQGYRRELLKKLNIEKNVELAQLAAKFGMIDLESI